jgi:hypothetical protein
MTSIIDEQMNLHINDGNGHHTFSFTSSSMGGDVQFPPVFSGDL